MAKTTTSGTKAATKTTPSARVSAKASAAKTPPAGKAASGNTAVAAKGSGAKPATTPAKAAAPATITVRQLSSALAEKYDLPKKQADAITADMFGSVVGHLKAGDRVRIAGLGIIEVKNRAARMGRNPGTGEAIQIKASKKIAFRPAKELKDAI